MGNETKQLTNVKPGKCMDLNKINYYANNPIGIYCYKEQGYDSHLVPLVHGF